MSEDSDSKQSLVAISDLFGLGEAAKSKAFERLVSGVTHGIGEAFHAVLGGWKAKRDLRANAEAVRDALDILPRDAAVELDIAGRFELRVKREAEQAQLAREEVSRIALSLAPHQLTQLEENQEDRNREISRDWLTRFWKEAENVSDEQLRVLWAKVLLRKSVNPDDFSIRSLQIVSQLSKDEAEMIEALAPYVVEFDQEEGFVHRYAAGLLFNIEQYQGTFIVPDDVQKDFRERVLAMLPKVDNVALDAAGIIQSVNGWASEFTIPPINEINVRVGNQKFVVTDLPPPNEQNKDAYRIGYGRGFTREGCQIARIVDAPPNDEYLNLICKAFESAGCRVIDVIDDPQR